jgi:hypothetical protein
MTKWRKLAFTTSAALVAAVTLPGTVALAQAPEAHSPQVAQSQVVWRLPQDPAVLSARALPGALPTKGGEVEVVAKVRGATSCRLVVLRDHGVKVSLPKPTGCAGGSYRERAGFGPDAAQSATVVKLGLRAGSSMGVFYVVVAGNPAHPSVVSAKASPWRLGYQGGTVVVEGRVSGARVCRLAVLDNPGVAVQLPKPAGCAKGTYDEKVAFGPNKSYSQAVVKLGLFPYGLVRKYVGTFFVALAGAPKPPVTTTTTTTPPPPPATTTPTTQPPAPSSGGGGGGMPFPLPPPPAATTTTTVPPATTTTTAPPPPTLTAAASTVQVGTSDNWSGYVVNGPQPYTSATGTFTVTGLTSTDSCNDQASEWVGIDGLSSSGVPDAWLIQAGVIVYINKYANGQCEPSNTYGVYPWWEVITPSSMPPDTAIIEWDKGPLAGQPATVNIGDQVTVTIGQVADSACSPATECWQIEVVDDTTGGVYVTDQPYAGPGSSAEWIVENPDQVSNPNCPAYAYSNETLDLCPMPDYSPPVAFSGLSATPDSASGWTDFEMTVPGCTGSGCQVVSEPSALSADPSLGFDVSYTGTTNSGMVVGTVRTLGTRVPAPVRTLGTPMPSR